MTRSYFKNKDKNFHGIMFHSFHDKYNFKSQGSINDQQLEDIIHLVGVKNILSCDEVLNLKILPKNKVCFTFDDSLSSQFKVAKKILDKYQIKAFFFVYTCNFTKEKNYIEVFKYFRHEYFESINSFYEAFYKKLFHKFNIDKDNEIFLKKEILKKWQTLYKSHTLFDLEFRIIRDHVITHHQYEIIMFEMLKEKNIDYLNLPQKLQMKKKNLINLSNEGHQIGLHTHYHYTNFAQQTKFFQNNDLKKNFDILKEIINVSPKSIAYPCGSYNKNILQFTKDLGIKIGFKDHMLGHSKLQNLYLINRQNHSNIIRKFKI